MDSLFVRFVCDHRENITEQPPQPVKLEAPIEDQVRDLIITSLLVEDPSALTPQTNLIVDLDAGSLDCVELIMDLEQAFECEISDEEAEMLVLVQHVIDLIKRKKKERRAVKAIGTMTSQ